MSDNDREEMQYRPLGAAELEQAATNASDEYDLMLARMRWHTSTPYAETFGAVIYEEVQAFSTWMRCDDVGRITSLKYEALMRTGAEIRAALATALVARIEAEGCTTQLVHAATADIAFWAERGFVQHEELFRYTGGKFLQATHDEVIILEPWHRMAVMRMDQKASGEDRSTLVVEHEYLGRVYEDGKTMRGFSLALLGEGLTIADTPAIGNELLRWHFPIQEHVILPVGNGAHAHLIERGYRAEPIGFRMVRGPAPHYRPDMLYAEPFGVV